MSREHVSKIAPVGQLEPQPWMTAPETQTVIAALTAEGAEVRFVGGCVRDAVLKRPIKDVDIATHEQPETVMALLEKAGIRAIPTGIEHGTVTAVVNHKHYEITTLREDVETFGRRARVAFTDDWVADAARRDFTMNAMFASPDGAIYDPFDGLADLGAGRVRFVGNPTQRLKEDVLRLLRFFRFHAWYGHPPADPEALAACQVMAPELPKLSGERVAGELIRLLLAPDAAGVLLLMQGTHILQHILPEARDFGRLRMLSWLETRAMVRPQVAPDPIRRLAAALETDAEGAAAVAERLRLSNRQTEQLVLCCAPPVEIHAGLSRQELRKLLRKHGPERVRDLALIAWAAHRNLDGRTRSTETGQWFAILDEIDGWHPVELPVRGQDLIELGVSKGPRIGQLLGEVERWWEEGDYRAGRDECLERLRQVVPPP